MKMNRRTFLSQAIAVALVPVLPKLPVSVEEKYAYGTYGRYVYKEYSISYELGPIEGIIKEGYPEIMQRYTEMLAASIEHTKEKLLADFFRTFDEEKLCQKVISGLGLDPIALVASTPGLRTEKPDQELLTYSTKLALYAPDS